jgi:hypothetical protein
MNPRATSIRYLNETATLRSAARQINGLTTSVFRGTDDGGADDGRADDGLRTRDPHLGKVIVSSMASGRVSWAAFPSTQFPLNPPEIRPVVDRSATSDPR